MAETEAPIILPLGPSIIPPRREEKQNASGTLSTVKLGAANCFVKERSPYRIGVDDKPALRSAPRIPSLCQRQRHQPPLKTRVPQTWLNRPTGRPCGSAGRETLHGCTPDFCSSKPLL